MRMTPVTYNLYIYILAGVVTLYTAQPDQQVYTSVACSWEYLTMDCQDKLIHIVGAYYGKDKDGTNCTYSSDNCHMDVYIYKPLMYDRLISKCEDWHQCTVWIDDAYYNGTECPHGDTDYMYVMYTCPYQDYSQCIGLPFDKEMCGGQSSIITVAAYLGYGSVDNNCNTEPTVCETNVTHWQMEDIETQCDDRRACLDTVALNDTVPCLGGVISSNYMRIVYHCAIDLSLHEAVTCMEHTIDNQFCTDTDLVIHIVNAFHGDVTFGCCSAGNISSHDCRVNVDEAYNQEIKASCEDKTLCEGLMAHYSNSTSCDSEPAKNYVLIVYQCVADTRTETTRRMLTTSEQESTRTAATRVTSLTTLNPAIVTEDNTRQPDTSNDNKGLVIGLSAGGAVVVLIVIIAVSVVCVQRRDIGQKARKDDHIKTGLDTISQPGISYKTPHNGPGYLGGLDRLSSIQNETEHNYANIPGVLQNESLKRNMPRTSLNLGCLEPGHQPDNPYTYLMCGVKSQESLYQDVLSNTSPASESNTHTSTPEPAVSKIPPLVNEINQQSILESVITRPASVDIPVYAMVNKVKTDPDDLVIEDNPIYQSGNMD